MQCNLRSLIFIFIFIFNQSFVCAEETDNKNNNHEIQLNNDENYFKSVKTKEQACSILEKKIVASINLTYYVKNCTLRLIKDPQTLNYLIQIYNKNVITLPNNIYSLLPIGDQYSNLEFRDEYLKNEIKLSSLCEKYKNKILTENGYKYYFIEKCKKRLFSNKADISLFSKTDDPIVSVEKYLLEIIPEGEPMKLETSTTPLKEKTEQEMLYTMRPVPEICKTLLSAKIVSFHSSFFYFKDCTLFQIIDPSIDLQIKAEHLGGIKELTKEQRLGLPEGPKMKESDILKKLH